MLGALSRGLLQHGQRGGTAMAVYLQQLRHLNIHEYQASSGMYKISVLLNPPHRKCFACHTRSVQLFGIDYQPA